LKPAPMPSTLLTLLTTAPAAVDRAAPADLPEAADRPQSATSVLREQHTLDREEARDQARDQGQGQGQVEEPVNAATAHLQTKRGK